MMFILQERVGLGWEGMGKGVEIVHANGHLLGGDSLYF